MVTIVGATGNVGSKIADILIKKNEPVRLVARTANRLAQLAGNRAIPLAGDANDTEFLLKAFKDVDAVYTLIPPNPNAFDFMQYADKIGNSIALALEITKVKHVVNISSIGAELSDGTGPIKGLHNMEERLNKIKGLNVLHVRASYFMENLLWSIDMIRSKGINGNAIRGDLRIPMIATRDVASYVADRLVRRDFWGSSIQELGGPRGISLIEATEIIGRKIDMPGLFYLMFPYDEAEKGMVAMGLSPDMSHQYIEMNRAFNDGRIKLEARTSQISTTTSFEEFCDDVFVPLYAQKKAA
jgi:uncharacterized protein YbjT (DUF2867 family)